MLFGSSVEPKPISLKQVLENPGDETSDSPTPVSTMG